MLLKYLVFKIGFIFMVIAGNIVASDVFKPDHSIA